MNHFSIKLRTLLLQNKIYYIIFLISVIISSLFIKYYKFKSVYNINDSEFILTIYSYKMDGDKLNLELHGKENLIANYYFKTLEEKENFINDFEIGDVIKVKGSLSVPNNNTIPNTFNYKEYLKYKKIHYILKIDNFNIYKENKNIFYKLKNMFYKRIYQINNNEFIYALVLGDSSLIDGNSFRNNGVSHLFALSGLHVSLMSLILLKIFNIIKKKEDSIIIYIIIFMLLLLYSFLTGFRPSLLRAVLFFLLIGINKIYYLYVKGENLLIVVLFIMVLINPFILKDTSFLLSWTITFFLLFTSELYVTKNYVLNLLRTSLIALVCSLPIVINNFYTINLLSLINNIIFVPFVSFIVYPLSLLTFVFPILNKILYLVTQLLNIMSKYIENVNIFIITFSKMNIYEIIIYYLIIILIIKKRPKVKYIIILFIFIIYLYFKPYIFSSNKIYIVDVSQGDSALISINNKNILIDTGGIQKYKEKEEWKQKNKEFNVMNSNIIPFFKSIGIKKINSLIITHGDFDHMGEAINLVNNFKVENVIFNCGEFNELEQELIKVLDQKKIKYYSCIKELNIDKYKLVFLNTREYENENDNSNVIYYNYYNYKFLFMGDAGVEKEKDILDKYNLNDIDFLKVGHHGSNTSSSKDFIDKINPKLSLISVGKNNRYGHPKDEVLEILKNSKIYRTDLDGSIEIKLNKSVYKIKTCPP